MSVRGIRDRIASRAALGDFEDQKQIVQPSFRDALRLLAKHRLHFEAFAYHHQLRDVAAQFPGLAVSRRATQGFEVESAEVVFRGLCDACRRSPQDSL